MAHRLNYTLGPLPWSEERLRQAYFKSFTATRKAIQELPGFQVHRDLLTLQLSLNIFRDAVTDLMKSIDLFHGHSQESSFWTRPERQRFEQHVIMVQRGIFSAVTSAMALFAYSRIICDRLKLGEYRDRFSAEFDKSEEHQFIYHLRNCICHVSVIEVGWQCRISYITGERSTRFLLEPQLLFEYRKWDKLSRTFIKRHPEGIDAKELFEKYRTRVDNFYEWVFTEITRLSEPNLSEYRQYERILNRFDVKSWWNVILKQQVIGKRDPYAYLERYLTKAELDEVLALPMRSKEQVDRIIEIVDEYGACDDDLKATVYSAFGVSSR